MRTVWRQYCEVNSVKNTTINIWLNDGVYYLPTTLDTYKQRYMPQRFTHFYISHTCSISYRKPNAPSLRTPTHSKTPEADQTPRGEQKVPKNKEKDKEKMSD